MQSRAGNTGTVTSTWPVSPWKKRSRGCRRPHRHCNVWLTAKLQHSTAKRAPHQDAICPGTLGSTLPGPPLSHPSSPAAIPGLQATGVSEPKSQCARFQDWNVAHELGRHERLAHKKFPPPLSRRRGSAPLEEEALGSAALPSFAAASASHARLCLPSIHRAFRLFPRPTLQPHQCPGSPRAARP